ncbi:hypothetical protein HDEF_0216 [Candidatus Hamiltonella defensa 5AT (Acyrthosiphon pisum)]|uniref:Uncharacterized protein n=1 Tax=Hamiltonella defensa subsp. Acyrthosiphon pisum (strain 5AT) TaxID=572265 RepID=C4K341_HAMD5|nr:hypothetical protein HDEF_0216 [Candidatus Hamiltonella defensa 5AT (Acyrthosiphon pisum)]
MILVIRRNDGVCLSAMFDFAGLIHQPIKPVLKTDP